MHKAARLNRLNRYSFRSLSGSNWTMDAYGIYIDGRLIALVQVSAFAAEAIGPVHPWMLAYKYTKQLCERLNAL